MTLDPEKDLKGDTSYVVTISTAAQDESGNALAAAYEFAVTTESGASQIGLFALLILVVGVIFVIAVAAYLNMRRKKLSTIR